MSVVQLRRPVVVLDRDVYDTAVIRILELQGGQGWDS